MAHQDGDSPIDASGVLVDGTKVDGVASLRDSLVRRSDQFVRVVTEKMLTYALGRGVEYQDMPLVRSIVRDSAGGNYKFSSIVLGIVKSAPFQMNMKTAGDSSQRSGQLGNRRKTAIMFITKKHISRRTVLRGQRRDARAAASGRDDSGRDGAGANGGHSEAPLCRLLCAARHGARLLGPRHRGPARRRASLQLETAGTIP